MTMMAAEAGAGAVEGEATAASSAGRSAGRPRTGGRTQQGSQRARTGGRTQQGSQRRPSAAPKAAAAATPATRAAAAAAAARNRQKQRRQQKRQQRAAKAGKQLTGNYHSVVFGEFVLAIILVAATPFARKNRPGLSPYAGKDMIQLLAITVLYFLLAILAGTGRTQARFAAWFGGLILLAVGLSEAAAIAKAVAGFFGTPQGSTAEPDISKSGAAVVQAGEQAMQRIESTAGTSATGISRNVAQEPGTGLS